MSHPRLVTAGCVLLVVAAIVGIMLTGVPGRALRADSGASVSTSRQSATPSASRSEPRPSGTSKGLNAVTLPRGTAPCAVPVWVAERPLPDAEYAPYVRRWVACLVALYARPLARQAVTLRAPNVVGFRDDLRTACGPLSYLLAPASYCPASRTIYLALEADDRGFGSGLTRLAYVAMIAHEFGHHLQAVTGVDPDLREGSYRGLEALYAVARRKELQAACIEGASLAAMSGALGLTQRDRDEFRADRDHNGDEDPPEGRKPTHGSSTAQNHWFFRGLDTADLSRCDTWDAPEASVT